MAQHPALHTPAIQRCALTLLLGAAMLSSPAARADSGIERSADATDLNVSLRLHLGPLSRRSIEVGTLLHAETGHERLYAYVDLQDRLPLPVRRVLRQVDGGITVERGTASLAPEARSLNRSNLGSMLRWRLQDGTQVAIKLRQRKAGLQFTVPMQL
ncbi:hypothetical protein [Sphaerotilus mobilis]|nr:hypothetical protein [Sphaerotilus mobilis]